MRLSEAIREGCKYGPQLFNTFNRDDGSACAFGAALNANAGRALLDGDALTLNFKDLPWWQLLNTSVIRPCGCLNVLADTYNTITHLNDDHKWSREAIAEWVETIERKLGLWNEPKVQEMTCSSCGAIGIRAKTSSDKSEVSHELCHDCEAELTAKVEHEVAMDAIHGRQVELG